jgi:hypothetical protein
MREKRARTTQPKKKCPHNREKSKCVHCGGGSICEHRKQRAQCKDCGGTSICEHNRRRSECRDCGGALRSEGNSSARQIKDEITEKGENLGQWVNMIF